MPNYIDIGDESIQRGVPRVSRIITSERASEAYCDDILALMLENGEQPPCVVKADFSHAFLFSSIIKGAANIDYSLDTGGGYSGLQDQDTRLPIFMLKAKNRLLGYYIDSEHPKISFTIDVDSNGIVTFSQERAVNCLPFHRDLNRACFYSEHPLILLRSSLKFRDVNFISHQIDITKHFNFKNSYPVIIADQDLAHNYYELNNSRTIIL